MCKKKKKWRKCHPVADPSFKHSSKWFLKTSHWRPLASFDSLTCICHQLIYLNYSWISIFQQNRLSGKTLSYVYNPFQVSKVTLILIIRDQIKRCEDTVYTSFRMFWTSIIRTLSFHLLKCRVLFSTFTFFFFGTSLYGNWSIPFHLQLYWNFHNLTKMWTFTGKLLKSMKISFEAETLLKAQGITWSEKLKVRFMFSVLFLSIG